MQSNSLSFLIILFAKIFICTCYLTNFNNDYNYDDYTDEDYVKTGYIKQFLDHFNSSDKRVWSQRFHYFDKFFKTGSPVFLRIGGQFAEDTIVLEQSQLMDSYGPKFNAYLTALETRYYGESRPTRNTSLENLKYLARKQMFADVAEFIKKFKTEIDPRTRTSKWILFGCSFAATLAADMRLLYPNLVAGAVASSAPFKPSINFAHYLSLTAIAIHRQSKNCVINTRKAFNQLSLVIKTKSNLGQLEKFDLCHHLNISDSKSVALFMLKLITIFQTAAQYDRQKGYFWIEELCKIMNNRKIESLIERLAIVSRKQRYSCWDVSYENFINLLRKTSWDSYSDKFLGDRMYAYQTCTEYGSFQTTDQKLKVFGNFLPLE
ncbi:Serine carboxypeptidase S28-like protein [Dinothrombium tinctorium]|uniref:Serine carboxypeptidase S28-like protein n=1 Tax=Dinothrombium tinctorium TaxID=1965070 RepID=A0A443RCQ2_9ACAR|nr:Serine carboxypeptidase S28-like protein [Dinothrombium tinctorium]